MSPNSVSTIFTISVSFSCTNLAHMQISTDSNCSVFTYQVEDAEFHNGRDFMKKHKGIHNPISCFIVSSVHVCTKFKLLFLAFNLFHKLLNIIDHIVI